MSNTYTYRWGDTKPVHLPFDDAVAVNIGDLCYRNNGKVYPASNLTYGSAIADPGTAATIVAASSPAGPGLPAATSKYVVQYTYTTPWGESGLSPAQGSPITLTAGQGITVTGIGTDVAGGGLPAGVTGVNWYVSDATGANLKLYLQNQGQGFTVVAPNPSSAQSPPSGSSLLTALGATQYAFAQAFLGSSGQRYDGTSTQAYGIKDGNLRIDTAGVFELACATNSSFNTGDIVGMDHNGSTSLLSQQVIAVASTLLAVGRVVQPVTNGSTVLVQIDPSLARVAY